MKISSFPKKPSSVVRIMAVNIGESNFNRLSLFSSHNYLIQKLTSFKIHRNPSVFIDLNSLPKITESEADAAINETIFQHLSDLNEHDILNMMNMNSFTDRLDHEVADENLLPRKFECGDGAQFVNRVFGGDFTSISEFPWYVAFTPLVCIIKIANPRIFLHFLALSLFLSL